MGSVFPFSLFFLIAFFLVIIISVSLPSPLRFSQLALIGFSPADAPSDPEEGAKVLFLFSARQTALPEGWGRLVLLDWPTLCCGPSWPLVHLVRFAKLQDNFSAKSLGRITSC